MKKDRMMEIAERNLRKAERAIANNINRPGITEQERNNLLDHYEYARAVRELISIHIDE